MNYPFGEIIVYMIGDRLRQLRTDAGMGQPEFAAIAGTSKQYVGRLEKGQNKEPSPTLLLAWAKHFGVSLEWLISGKGPKSAVHKASHAVQWDFPKLSIAHRLLRESYEDAKREAYSVESEPEAMMEVYDKLIAAGDDTAAVVAIGRHLEKRELATIERTPERVGGNHPEEGRKRAGR